MGEIAEMMLEGVLCEGCGEYLGDGDGFPVRCIVCSGTAPSRGKKRTKKRQSDRATAPFICGCGRRFYAAAAMNQHRAAKRCSS